MSLVLRRPTTVAAAIEELSDEEALVLAGGQSLVLLMNTGLIDPDRLVSIAGIEELRGVTVTDHALDVGALCTHDFLAHHPEVQDRLPAAARMFDRVGNVRVRTAGTLGGNLVHADPAQDPPVLLSALEAEATVVGPDGTRVLAVEDVAAGPLFSSLDEGELLTRVRVPLLPEGGAATYLKFLPGTQDDYATVSVAARVATNGAGVVTDARLVAGAVGPTVIVLHEAAQTLVGHSPTDKDVLRAVGERVRDAVSPFPDRRGSPDYKREMAGVVARRAIGACTAVPGSSSGTTGATEDDRS